MATPAAIVAKAAEQVQASLAALVKGSGDAIETLTERAETAESERDEATAQAQADLEQRDWDNAALVEVLTDVKYWMHDVLIAGRPVANPLPLLRRIEDVLNELDPVKS